MSRFSLDAALCSFTQQRRGSPVGFSRVLSIGWSAKGQGAFLEEPDYGSGTIRRDASSPLSLIGSAMICR